MTPDRPARLETTDGLGILSPAERRVLEFVREGMLDAEIAVRLGVPMGDVKARVESMIQKLRLRDRAELAAWDPEEQQVGVVDDATNRNWAQVITPDGTRGWVPAETLAQNQEGRR